MTKRFFLFKGPKGYELRENVGGEAHSAAGRGVIAQSKKLSVLLESIKSLCEKIPHDSIVVVFSPHPALVCRKLNKKERKLAKETLATHFNFRKKSSDAKGALR